MKERLILILCAVLIVGASACSPSNTNSDAARANVNAAGNARNAATDPTNTNTIPESTSPNAPETVDSVLAAKKAKLDAMRNSDGIPDGTGANPTQLGVAATRPAPDNSEFSAVLTDIGRETRTFKDHPQLLKVEKLIEVKKQTIKIYLRGGKVIQLPGEKIPVLATASAAEILRAAGIQAATRSETKSSGKLESTKNEK